MNPRAEHVQRSKIACSACRSRKQRCDRLIPTCSSCTQRKIRCHFPKSRRGNKDVSTNELDNENSSNSQRTVGVPSSARVSANDAAPSRVAALTNNAHSPAVQPITVNSNLQLMEPTLFRHLHRHTPNLNPAIPSNIRYLTSDVQRIRAELLSYFDNVRECIPVMAKKKSLTLLLNPASYLQADKCLLALAIRLHQTNYDTDVNSSENDSGLNLYNIIKPFFWNLIGGDFWSLGLLQAGIIIIQFELGHALQAAAYMTLGSCASLAKALRIDRFIKSQKISRNYTGRENLPWLDEEENRRAWWAILILDRYECNANTNT